MFRLSPQRFSFDKGYSEEGVTGLLRGRVANARERLNRTPRPAASRGAQAVRMGHRRVTVPFIESFPHTIRQDLPILD